MLGNSVQRERMIRTANETKKKKKRQGCRCTTVFENGPSSWGCQVNVGDTQLERWKRLRIQISCKSVVRSVLSCSLQMVWRRGITETSNWNCGHVASENLPHTDTEKPWVEVTPGTTLCSRTVYIGTMTILLLSVPRLQLTWLWWLGAMSRSTIDDFVPQFM